MDYQTHTGADSELLGVARNFPVAIGWKGLWEIPAERVGSWSGMNSVNEIAPLVRWVARSKKERSFASGAEAVPGALRALVNEYLRTSRTCGLLVLNKGRIMLESYGYARTPAHQFLSYSMAKGVTSLLVGKAIAEGLLSLDDRVDKHVPMLGRGAYGKATVLEVLQMRPGVFFRESYDGGDDMRRLSTASRIGDSSVLDVLNSYPEGPPIHRYATADTEVLGRVLSSATSRSMKTSPTAGCGSASAQRAMPFGSPPARMGMPGAPATSAPRCETGPESAGWPPTTEWWTAGPLSRRTTCATPRPL